MKFRGPRGAFSALMGLILAPSIIVVLLGMVYDRFQNDPHVQHLFAGLAAAAAGLLISMAVKIGLPVIKRRDWLAASWPRPVSSASRCCASRCCRPWRC